MIIEYRLDTVKTAKIDLQLLNKIGPLAIARQVANMIESVPVEIFRRYPSLRDLNEYKAMAEKVVAQDLYLYWYKKPRSIRRTSAPGAYTESGGCCGGTGWDDTIIVLGQPSNGHLPSEVFYSGCKNY